MLAEIDKATRPIYPVLDSERSKYRDIYYKFYKSLKS